MKRETFRLIFSIVPNEDRRKGLLVLSLVCFSALFQVVGILSVVPFLVALSDPTAVIESPQLSFISGTLNQFSEFQLQIIMGLTSFGIILFAGILRIATFYAQSNFLQNQRYKLSSRLMRGYLAQPYLYFLERKSSDLLKSVMNETNRFIDQALVPASTILSSGLQAVLLLILLFAVQPGVAITSALFLAGTFACAFLWAQPRLARYGSQRHRADADRTQSAIEALTGIKAVKLSGKELRFAERFEDPARKANLAQLKSSAISQIPRHLIEAVAFGGMVLLALYTVVRSNAEGAALGTTVVPILVIYAFAGYRLLPAFQAIYASLSTLRYMNANVRDISAQIAHIEKASPLQGEPKRLGLNKSVEFDRVSFRYPKREKGGIDDISLTIPVGGSLGIVGRSGAGKTTLVDLFLGLLEPSFGEIRVDGVPLGPEQHRSWRCVLGYVPQDIFLTTRSLGENIAFGVPRDQIDMDQVIRCAKIVQLHDFVMGDLPEGYGTEIGERGTRLSGGQRQRIGIARALYFDPEVVIFDEATSALDTITEAAVLNAIDVLKQSKTVIIVSHRLSAVQDCDQIAVLENGKLVGLDNFHDLTRDNAQFQDLLAEAVLPAISAPTDEAPV